MCVLEVGRVGQEYIELVFTSELSCSWFRFVYTFERENVASANNNNNNNTEIIIMLIIKRKKITQLYQAAKRHLTVLR